jgi:hypothetical protein
VEEYGWRAKWAKEASLRLHYRSDRNIPAKARKRKVRRDPKSLGRIRSM